MQNGQNDVYSFWRGYVVSSTADGVRSETEVKDFSDWVGNHRMSNAVNGYVLPLITSDITPREMQEFSANIPIYSDPGQASPINDAILREIRSHEISGQPNALIFGEEHEGYALVPIWKNFFDRIPSGKKVTLIDEMPDTPWVRRILLRHVDKVDIDVRAEGGIENYMLNRRHSRLPSADTLMLVLAKQAGVEIVFGDLPLSLSSLNFKKRNAYMVKTAMECMAEGSDVIISTGFAHASDLHTALSEQNVNVISTVFCPLEAEAATILRAGGVPQDGRFHVIGITDDMQRYLRDRETPSDVLRRRFSRSKDLLSASNAVSPAADTSNSMVDHAYWSKLHASSGSVKSTAAESPVVLKQISLHA